MKTQFIEAFKALALEIHQTARDKGWWDNKDADFMEREILPQLPYVKDAERIQEVIAKLRNRNEGEMLALIHSETSEVLEGLRHGNPPDDKIPEFTGAEAELADVIIRVMDMAAARGWRVGEAIVAKMEMNKTRERMHGGKKF